MTGVSHLVVGAGNVLLASVIIGEKDPQVLIGAVTLGTLAAILPDIDAQNSLLQHHIFSYGKSAWTNLFISRAFRRSVIGSLIYAAASILEIGVRILLYAPIMFLKLFVSHRGITHTLVATIVGTFIFFIVAFMFGWLMLFPIAFFVGYSTHLLLDSMTRTGIVPFHPFSRKTFFLLPEKYRVVTGSSKELFWVAGWAILWLCLILLILQ